MSSVSSSLQAACCQLYPLLGSWEEWPSIGQNTKTGDSPKAGVEKGAALLFWKEGVSPTLAVTCRMDKSIYLGIRMAKFKTLLQGLHLIVMMMMMMMMMIIT